jgi:hypothetical protein
LFDEALGARLVCLQSVYQFFREVTGDRLTSAGSQPSHSLHRGVGVWLTASSDGDFVHRIEAQRHQRKKAAAALVAVVVDVGAVET